MSSARDAATSPAASIGPGATGLSGLLSGLRVIDLTRNLPGPFATRLLADLGSRIPAAAVNAQIRPKSAWSNFTPGFAIACARHETLDQRGV